MKQKLIFFSLFLFVMPALSVQAAGLIPCGSGNSVANACTLCHFIVGIKGIIDFGSGILVSASIAAIFFAGIMYIISSGNQETMTKAKSFLSSALIGFTIVTTAWFIVNIIMWILSANMSSIGQTNWYTFTCNPSSSAANPSTVPVTSGPTAGNTDAKNKLSAAGIQVTSSGNCSDINNAKCTSLEGIPASTIDNIINTKNVCGITPTITGGTETGHASHGAGKAVVDFSWNQSLAACLSKNAPSLNVSQICTTDADKAYRLNCGDFSESVEHIHVAYKP